MGRSDLMKLMEFQAKSLFARYGIPVPGGTMVESVEGALEAAEKIGLPVVVKAQVMTGGRGKAGGVKLASTGDEVRTHASTILGMDIKGYEVKRLLVDPAVKIARELYVGITMDRGRGCPVLMVSGEGGVDIEEVARKTPERISIVPVDPVMGLQMYQARRAAFDVFSEKKKAMSAAGVMLQLWSCFAGCDCSLAEINPLAELADGRIEALDAKIVLDDNALFRHPDLAEMRIPQADEIKELRAKEKGLSYVGLDGNIGCMVNGAGLAMATMDLVKHLGGKPANFLDIGGSSNPQKVIDAMELLLSDPGVEVIFINVFGGITRCDDVASGLVEAVQKTRLDLPLVVRLTGTNEEEGRRILAEAGIEATTEMRRGAELALQRASGGGSA